MPSRVFVAMLFLLVFRLPLLAQTIHGEVLDMDDKKPVNNVSIENIHTDFSVTSGADGGFLITATGGQLLEFRKGGYKTTRVRVPQGYIPSYFRIIMQKGISPLRDMYVSKDNRYDYKEDSLKFHELYQHELDFPKMSAMQMIASPFSAMSKKNRQIWQFQDDYADFEKEKYVDKTFNDAIVAKFTGLSGDSLRIYKRRFRPSYEQLRSMNDYNFYNYIRSNAARFRSRDRPVIGN